jgi:hypothetical protein
MNKVIVNGHVLTFIVASGAGKIELNSEDDFTRYNGFRVYAYRIDVCYQPLSIDPSTTIIDK